MSRNSRIAVLAGAVVLVVAGFLIANSSGGSNKAKRTSGHAYVYVVNGKPRGGIQTLVYNKGDQVVFTVVSDVSDEIHVHGFDFKKEVKKGGSVTFRFPATDQGDHVVELESRSEQIANLRVL
jgi:hypothetical protein